jgi:hypothetical protein
MLKRTLWMLPFLAACPSPSPSSVPAPKPSTPAATTSTQANRLPSSQPASQPAQPPVISAPFSGRIELAKDVKLPKLSPNAAVYIMVRAPYYTNKGVSRLVAVKRLDPKSLPTAFEISASDAMIPSIPFEGPFEVTARLDLDGDAMTRGEDDLYAAFAGPVEGTSTNVNLALHPKL